MIKLLIKKSFFDFWDNMGISLVINLIFGGLLALLFFVPSWLTGTSLVLSVISFYVVLLIISLYVGLAARFLHDITDYNKFEWSNVKKYFKESWLISLIIGASVILYASITSFGFSFYLNIGGFMGVFGAAVFFWLTFILLVSLQFFFAIRHRLENKFFKIIKKSFMLAFDNLFLSLFVLIWGILIAALSVPCMLFVPSLSGLLIWTESAVKLMLKKYDYLEANPEANRRKIPWSAILMDEDELVGKRTFKGMIFPTKYQ